MRIVYDACETPIHETTQEDINDLLASGHEVDNDRPPAPKKKPSPAGYTERSVYKEGCKWSGIYHRRAADCRQDSEKLNGMKN